MNEKTCSPDSPGIFCIMRGVDSLSDSVRATFGPTVVRDGPSLALRTTRQNVAAADRSDRIANLGARLLQQAARDASRESGDGTTTAIILAQSILKSASRSIQLGLSAAGVRRGIDEAIALADEHVRTHAKTVRFPEDALDAARTASHDDQKIARSIVQAINTVGVSGVIAAEIGDTKSEEDIFFLTRGAHVCGGLVSTHLCTDVARLVCEYDQPQVLIYEGLEAVEQIMPVLEHASQSRRPLLVIASHMTSDVVRTLVLSRLRNVARVAAVHLIGAGDQRAELLEDLALLSGARIVSAGATLASGEEISQRLGELRRFVQSAHSSILLATERQERMIDRHIGFMHDTMKVCDDDQRQRLAAQLERLAGRAVLLRLSAKSEAIGRSRLRRFGDTLHAVRAALAEGVVAGGGVALLQATQALPRRTVCRDGFEAGIEAVRSALESPIRQLCENVGLDGEHVLATLYRRSGLDLGFDVRTGKFVHMFSAGIVDASRVVRTALTCAGAAASLLLVAAESMRSPGNEQGNVDRCSQNIY